MCSSLHLVLIYGGRFFQPLFEYSHSERRETLLPLDMVARRFILTSLLVEHNFDFPNSAKSLTPEWKSLGWDTNPLHRNPHQTNKAVLD